VVRKPSLLLVTTGADLSLELFKTAESSKLIEPHLVHYNASEAEINKSLKPNCNFVYFRDPFNDSSVSLKTAQKNTGIILEHYKSARKVDSVSSYNDMLFEDKWRQYELFYKFMPRMKILNSLEIPAGKFVKKRISSRSKGVIFTQNDFPKDAKPEDYIVQPWLDIEAEYRVFMVGDQVIKPLAIKTSKTVGHKVKTIGLTEELDPQMLKICSSVYQEVKFDLVGLDIAKIPSGYCLLEVNRSPQFNTYQRLSSINLATHLYQRLDRGKSY
jgi:hypothetical protein